MPKTVTPLQLNAIRTQLQTVRWHRQRAVEIGHEVCDRLGKSPDGAVGQLFAGAFSGTLEEALDRDGIIVAAGVCP
jgi:hypothetical protein